MDVYAFNGGAGDHALVNLQETAGDLQPELRVYRPDGSLRCADSTIFALLELECVLDVTGKHTIFAIGSVAGNYDISLVCLSPPCAPPNPAPTPTPTPTKQPEPGDTDGDGCSDQRENGPDQFEGGRRNYLYEWDYYDVNGDGGINIPGDILPVAGAFGSNDPDYTPQKDRSPGPPPGVDPDDPDNNERWDLGPPDGVINIPDDILGVAFQFGHNCA